MVLIDADRCEAFRGLGQELASIGVDNVSSESFTVIKLTFTDHVLGSSHLWVCAGEHNLWSHSDIQTLDSVIQAVDAHRLKACISDVRKSSDADMVLGPENDAVIFFSSG